MNVGRIAKQYFVGFGVVVSVCVTSAQPKLDWVWQVPIHSGAIDVAYSKQGDLVATAGDSTLKVWDSQTLKLLSSTHLDADSSLKVDFSPDGRVLVCGTGRSVCAVSVRNGNILWETRLHPTSSIEARYVRYSPDGKYIAVSKPYSQALILDSQTGSVLHTFTISGSFSAYGIDFNPAAAEVAISWANGEIHIYQVGGSWSHLRTIFGFGYAIDFDSTGTRLAAAQASDAASSVHLWDAISGNFIRNLGGHTTHPVDLAFTPDDQEVISISGSGTLIHHNPDTGEIIRSSFATSGSAIAVSPSGDYYVSGHASGTLRRWRRSDGSQLAMTDDRPGPIVTVNSDPLGQRVLTSYQSSGWPDRVRVWSASGIPEAYVGDFGREFSQDGQAVYCGRYETLLARSVADLSQTWSSSFGSAVINDIDCSGSSAVLAVALSSGCKIVDSTNGQVLQTIGTSFNRRVRFSRSGSVLAIGTNTGAVSLIDTSTWSTLFTLSNSRTTTVHALSFSADGSKLYVAKQTPNLSTDHRIEVWDTATGLELSSIPLSATPIAMCHNSAGDLLVVLGLYDMFVFDTTTGQLRVVYANQVRAAPLSTIEPLPAKNQVLISGYNSGLVWIESRVSGSLSLLDYFGEMDGFAMPIEVWQNNSLVEVLDGKIRPNGTYSCSPNVNGLVTLKFAFRTGLVKSVDVTLGELLLNGVDVDLTNGDCDHDNEVGPGDFGMLSSAFGTTVGDPGYTGDTDLDGDGEVGPSDFGILSANFGLSGD